MKRRRFGTIVAVAALVGVVLYAALWYRGGLRSVWGLYSGSRLPAEARDLSTADRQSQTEERAREILRAILAFEVSQGRLPHSLRELNLPRVPAPLTSTLPFRYEVRGSREFIIEWEASPNAMYQRYWMDRNGKLDADL